MNGAYSVKSFCLEANKCEATNSDCHNCFVWLGLAPPKVEVFTWLAVLGKLNTRDFLSRIGIVPIEENICPFCRDAEETIEHIFIQCSLIWGVWNELAKWWGLVWVLPSSIPHLFDQWPLFVIGKLQKQVWYMLFFAALWTIWLERNNIVFNDKEFSRGDLLPLIICRVSTWIKAKGLDIPYSFTDMLRSSEGLKRLSIATNPRKSVSWSSPPKGWIKWNVDGSSLGKPGKSGIGGVLRDPKGQVICTFSEPLGVLESNEAEVIAIRRALQLTAAVPGAERLKVIVETDSLNAFTWITKAIARPWRMTFDFNTIATLKETFDEVKFQHILREANGMTDSFAKQGVRRTNGFVAWINSPHC